MEWGTWRVRELGLLGAFGEMTYGKYPGASQATGPKTQVLMWNGKHARDLNFAQEVNKREMGCLGGVTISRVLCPWPLSIYSTLIFWNDIFFSQLQHSGDIAIYTHIYILSPLLSTFNISRLSTIPNIYIFIH